MTKPLKKKKSTGAVRMRQLGKIASQLWYTPEQYRLVRLAAKIVSRPMTMFAKLATLKAARYTLMNPKDPSALERLKGPEVDGEEI